ncbi:MAG: cation:proton antiporter [Candidatus Melainabacteria bacterium]|nr:cation:proton antiporter [Candidatus Melainabacteria bacterium]
MTDTTLIFTVAAGFTMAFVLGLLAFKLRLSPIVGYLAAGIVIGPYTPGMVANSQLAAELSELGIILLMFGVGLHFSTKDLLAVSKAAYLGAIPQIALSAVGG